MNISPKNAVIVIMPITGGNPGSVDAWQNNATPDWLYAQMSGDEYLSYYNVANEAEVLFPKFWSATYQAKFGELLTALAAEFDLSDLDDELYGETEIEYIRVTGLGVSTTEPSFYNHNTDDTAQDQSVFRAQLEDDDIQFSTGNRPFLSWNTNDDCPDPWTCSTLYKQATVDIWTLWTDAFCNVPLAVTMKFPHQNETNAYYLGMIESVGDYFGLAPCEGGDNEIDVLLHTSHTTGSCAMKSLRGKMLALQSSTLKIGWGDVNCTSNPISWGKCCVLLDLAREAIGWLGIPPNGNDFVPVSNARYITLGSTRWSNPDDDPENVWGWADAQLEDFNASNAPPECTETGCVKCCGAGCGSDPCNSSGGPDQEYDGRGG